MTSPHIKTNPKHDNDTNGTNNDKIDWENKKENYLGKSTEQNNMNDDNEQIPSKKGNRNNDEMSDTETLCLKYIPKQAPDQGTESSDIVKSKEPGQQYRKLPYPQQKRLSHSQQSRPPYLQPWGLPHAHIISRFPFLTEFWQEKRVGCTQHKISLLTVI